MKSRKTSSISQPYARTGWELVQLMKQHTCTKKEFVSADNPKELEIGYECKGCGWQVHVGLLDLKKEMDCLKMLWRLVKTTAGRKKFGEALSS